MNLRRVLLPLASLFAIGGIIVWEFASSRTGPGPLHPAHGELDSIFGSDCSSCHRAGAGTDPDGCIRCHEPIGAQRTAKRGLHGSLPRQQLDDCSQCHSEHHGPQTPLIAPQAFANAGVLDADVYDHRHVADYGLKGAHAALACDRCHPAAKAAQPRHGGRFLGASQACAACHEDVHHGAFGKDCEKCHGQEQKFRAAPGFDHAIFPLLGAHARVDCVKCHAEGTVRSTEALSVHPLPARKCAECHEDPHHATAQRPAKALLLADTGDCARCHDSTKWAVARVTPEQHEKFGFPLRGGHQQAECYTCHGDGTHKSRHGPPQPKVESCARCHQDPHTGKFVQLAVAGQGPADGCAGCHQDDHADFRAATTTAAQHAATGFLLAAPHAEVACKKCHSGADFGARFPGRKAADCRACHQDVHLGQFDHEPRYGQCTACHLPTTFAPNAFGIDKHTATAFPLTGSHDAVGCTKCHTEVVLKFELEVRTFRGTKQECSECHEDVHKGAFDTKDKPKVVDGRVGCARCHDTTAFAPVSATAFDHGKWTGYALDGAHAPLLCAKCHVQTAKDKNRHLGVVKGKRCADCHRDQHQGQFAERRADGAIDCAHCHGTAEWKQTRFDHGRDSRFALDAQHAPLACDKCHKTYASPAGPVVRYKPLGTQCGDCHRLGKKGEVEGKR